MTLSSPLVARITRPDGTVTYRRIPRAVSPLPVSLDFFDRPARVSTKTNPQVVYGPADVARALGISVGYVFQLIKAGTARPSVLMGDAGRRIFSREDLEQLAVAIGRPAPPMVK